MLGLTPQRILNKPVTVELPQTIVSNKEEGGEEEQTKNQEVSIVFAERNTASLKIDMKRETLVAYHVVQLSTRNMQMHVGWTILTSFMTLIPKVLELDWVKGKMDRDWQVLWKRALAPPGTANGRAQLGVDWGVGEPQDMGKAGQIQSGVGIICGTMPWTDRSHVMQSRACAVENISELLRALVSLEEITEGRESFYDIMEEKSLGLIVRSVKNALRFAENALESPPPPAKALDLGAICGESHLMIADSILVDSGVGKSNTDTSRNPRFGGSGWREWSIVYLNGIQERDLDASDSALPCYRPIADTHLDLRNSVITCSTCLAMAGAQENFDLVSTVLRLSLYVLASSNNLIEIFREKAKFAARNVLETAVEIQSSHNFEAGVVVVKRAEQKQNIAMKKGKGEPFGGSGFGFGFGSGSGSGSGSGKGKLPARTYLVGFRNGSWGYEAEVGETSLLAQVVYSNAILPVTSQSDKADLALAYGLNYGADFTRCHFGALEFGYTKMTRWSQSISRVINKLLPIQQTQDQLSTFCGYTTLVDSCVQYVGLVLPSLDENSQLQVLQESLNRMQKLPYNSHRQGAILTNYLALMFSSARALQSKTNYNSSIETKSKKNVYAKSNGIGSSSSSSSSSSGSGNGNGGKRGRANRLGSKTVKNLFPISVARFMGDVARSALIIPSYPHRLVASEVLGLLALSTKSSGEYLTPLLDHLTHQAIRSRDRFAKAGTALALGSIYAHAGSIVASKYLQRVVVMLHSLSNDPDPLVHSWAMRALAEAASSAGFMFHPFGQITLKMAFKLYLSDSHLYPFIGETQLVSSKRVLPGWAPQEMKRSADDENKIGAAYYEHSGGIFRSNTNTNNNTNTNTNTNTNSNSNVQAKISATSAQKKGNVKTSGTESKQKTLGLGRKVAMGKDSAFHHPNSATHRYDSRDGDSALKAMGASTYLSMGVEHEWTKVCCERDLDGFDSRDGLGKLMNSVIGVMGPEIQFQPETRLKVCTLIREFLKLGQSIGVGSQRMMTRVIDLEQEELMAARKAKTKSTTTTTTNIRQNLQTNDTKAEESMISSNKQEVMGIAISTIGEKLSGNIVDLDATALTLSHAILMFQQQRMFFPNTTYDDGNRAMDMNPTSGTNYVGRTDKIVCRNDYPEL
ncbi:HEAT repeat-containing protein 5A [Zancudomyces culisetae]|uniref:HEAT repeat-containing protein 5A n=1 Tax=Zancudomyces culisetae TaxID=1213189 RepID=A0A1R1PZ85_ZANCU|nr:HEAT repeat-containing protein 5A [Zancudomyces culisetae]|eukprot:OMH86256.1 HEAT repeat-containing protein 5A [Zancudomyces culisetae]